MAFEHFTSPSSPIFRDIKILKLHDLFQLKLLNFVYESVNKLSPSSCHTFFELAGHVHQYGTRQVENYDIFLTRKNTLQYGLISVRFCDAKTWNKIPIGIKRSSSVQTFRQKLEAFLFEKY